MAGSNYFILSFWFMILHGVLFGQTELLEINSAYDEFHPRLFQDDALYFTRAFHPKNLGKDNDPGDIWQSMPSENGKWEPPIHVPELSTEGFDVVLGFEHSGDAFVYHDDQKGFQGIFRYQFKENKWHRIGQEEIPGLENFGSTFGGYIHPDGDLMFVSMQSYGALGNEDLYVIEKRENGNWSRPVNLGGDVNSHFQELSPFISEDKLTLFFSSNGHGREQGTGVFVSRRLSSFGYKRWSMPQPVQGLPSLGKVTHYSLDHNGGNAFFTNTISSEHYGNLYSGKGTIPELLGEEENVEEDKPTETIVELLPLSSKEGLPASGNRELEEEAPQLMDASEVGGEPTAVDYLHNLQEKYKEADFNVLDKYGERVENLERYWGPLNDLYAFVIKEGYMPYAIDWEERPEEIPFLPAKPGNKLVLKQVNFNKGTAEFSDLLADSFLEMIAQFLTQNPQQLIQVEGHTDNFGSAQLNKDLSLRRAAKVRDILVEKGIAFDKIRVTGHGGSRPVSSNQTEEGKELNRRVELLIVE